MPLQDGLIAHWPLSEDARDASGNENHGEAYGAVFRDGAAWFDGRGPYIEVPHAETLAFGTRPFTISVRVSTERALDHVLGDVLCKFDPATRRGINFGLLNYAGVTSSQCNHRNVFFGIDDAKLDPQWTDCGRPGNAVCVFSLCVHDGNLYAGTFEMGKDEAGHVFRYAGNQNWIDCGVPYPASAVSALAEFDGALYAAVSHYRSRGSAMADPANDTMGGKVFRYAGGVKWVDCGTLPNPEAIFGLAVYKGMLYASSMYAPPGLYRYDGGTTWSYCGHPGGRIEALTVYRGHLYGAGFDEHFGGVYRYLGGEQWADCGTPEGTTQTYSFMSHYGDLYVGTWPGGAVFRYDGEKGWRHAGRLGEELEVMPLAVYNGKMYGGTLPLAHVYRYEKDGQWTFTGQLDTTPDAKYRRAWSMAVYDGRLFCGTLPSGRVFSIRAGQAASYDRALEPGWRHLAAVRDADRLRLFVDGAQVAESVPFEPDSFDLTTSAPLTIGFGPHDYFNGAMRDLRIYNRALDARDIQSLAV